MYELHPSNVVRLILNRDEPGDENPDGRYDRAARHLKNWKREGVLQVEHQASLYVYHQNFTFAGQEYHRAGFMCRVRLERFGEGKIYPHEQTHAAAKADRLKLINACKTNLSQIFGLYPDPENQVRTLLDAAIAGETPLEATDHLGVLHQMWPIHDVKIVSEVSALMDPKPMFVADGHHRYETACNYRDQLAAEKPLDANHPANFVMTMCVGMSDPGMIVLPTHRLFRGIPALSSEQLLEKIGPYFQTRVAGEGTDLAASIWEEIETENAQGTLGLYCETDDRWVVAKINQAGVDQMAQLEPDQSTDWRSLGVSILARLVMDHCLGATNLPKPMYVHSIDEVIKGLDEGDTTGRDATGQMGQGGKFPLAALVMPATLEHVRSISENNERMPAKSTYFYPKLLSGLVFNPIE